MTERNVPRKTGRIRGHRNFRSSQAAQFVVEEMHQSRRHGESPTPRRATKAAMARMKQAGIKFKPAQTGGEGRVPLNSPSTRRANLMSAKRKPAARRGRARKRALQG